MYTYQLQKEMNVPHLSSCMEDGHEKDLDLQVLVKEDAIEYLGQTLVLLQKYIQEDIPFKSTRKNTYFSMD